MAKPEAQRFCGRIDEIVTRVRSQVVVGQDLGGVDLQCVGISALHISEIDVGLFLGVVITGTDYQAAEPEQALPPLGAGQLGPVPAFE